MNDLRAKLNAGADLSAILLFLIGVGALYVGREVFIPLALAILLSFVLAPLVTWLQRRGIPKIGAVVSVVVVAVIAFCIFAFVTAGQLVQLAGNLPAYQANIQTKVRDLKAAGSADGLVSRLTRMFDQIDAEVEKPADVAPGNGSQAAPPLEVKLAPERATPAGILQNIVGPLLPPLVTAGIVLVFVIFILLQREDLRDRFIRLASAGDVVRTTRALEEASDRVATFLLMQVLVNVSYGVPIGIGLWLIGVPNAVLFGSLAVILRFIPYIGPLAAAVAPIVLAIAVDSGWTMALWTIGLFLVVELVSNNVIEPWLYGSKTGLSPLAILVAAVFWTWLWGPVGLLLSTPLTVCLVVLGRHVPQFAFLDVLLGAEPVLTPPERLHQRLLAANVEEATINAEEYLADHEMADYYREVFVPAMVALEQDRARGALDRDRRDLVLETVGGLLENLAIDGQPDDAVAQSIEEDAARRARTVVCVGGRGHLDAAAATGVAQFLDSQGFSAAELPVGEVHLDRIAARSLAPVGLICIVYLNQNMVAHASYLVRRLRRRLPHVPVAVFAPADRADATLPVPSEEPVSADFAATSLADLAKWVQAHFAATGAPG